VPMSATINIYCDESCHLENDQHTVMVLGAVWCPAEQSRKVAEGLRAIKIAHGLAPDFEIKWTKVSPARIDFYLGVVEYFFDSPDLHFRALIVPDKAILRHEQYEQEHDTWYYKMYFDMLKVVLNRDNHHRIYFDIKDTHSSEKLAKLKDILRSNAYDYDRRIIERVQAIRSHHVEQIQLVDLLIGVVSYANRNLSSSSAKMKLVEFVRARSRYRLTATTLLSESKFNLFRWEPRRPPRQDDGR
jgi:hypothetical protein